MRVRKTTGLQTRREITHTCFRESCFLKTNTKSGQNRNVYKLEHYHRHLATNLVFLMRINREIKRGV